MSNASGLKFQITIPNEDTPSGEPTLSVIVESMQLSDSSEQAYQCSLNDLFAQVAESYRHDKSALHRFSYYLLLQAKEFAQDDVLVDESLESAINNQE